MADDIVGVKIIADASGVAPGVDEAKSEIGGLSSFIAGMKEQFSAIGVAIKEAFGMGAGSVDTMKNALGGLQSKTDQETMSLREMIATIHEGAESVRSFQMRAKEFAEVYVAMFAVEQVGEFIAKMGEAAEVVAHLAQTFGMSVEQIQQLQGVATATGIPIDSLTRGMAILDKGLVNAKGSTSAQAEAFKALGVSIDDGRSQMEKMFVIADKFALMADGPKKVALAMEVFGKSGKDLIPVLNLGSAGMEELTGKLDEYGAASKTANGLSEEAVTRGLALAESVNETKLAHQGLANVLTDALAPVLKEVVDGVNSMVLAFVQSYESGGIVADVFTVISGTVSVLVEVLRALGSIFETLWSAIVQIVGDIAGAVVDAFGIKIPSAAKTADAQLNITKDAFVILKDVVIIVIDTIVGLIIGLIDQLRLFASIAKDALTLNWSAITADWKAGFDRIATDAENSAHRIAAAFNEAKAAIGAAMQGEALPGGETGVKTSKGGAGSFDPTLGAAHKPKKEKKPKAEKDTTVKDAEDELEAQKVKFAELQAAQGTYETFSLAQEEKFWEAQKNRADVSGKDKLELEKKWLSARAALHKEDQSNTLSAIKSGEAIQMDAAKNEIALAKLTLQEKLQIIDEEAKAGNITATKAAQEKGAVHAQFLALDRDLANKEYEIKRAALVDELQRGQMTLDQRKKVNQQIELLEQQHANLLVQINARADLEKQKDDAAVVDAQRKHFDQMFQGFSQNIAKMVTAQQGFAATLNGIWKSMLGNFEKMIQQMIEHWIVGLVVKEAVSKSANEKDVIRDAMAAARGAYKAMVGIPIIGPVLAPIAAGVAFAAVSAFSAQDGFDIPAGVNPVTQLHQREMVLPAQYADVIRGLAANGNGGGSSGESGGGDVHLHVHAMDGQSVRRFLMDNKHHVAESVKAAHRYGSFAGVKN
jgi:hypothetical protein